MDFHLNTTGLTCFPVNLFSFLNRNIESRLANLKYGFTQTHTHTFNEHPLNSTPAQLESTSETGSGQHISLHSYNG